MGKMAAYSTGVKGLNMCKLKTAFIIQECKTISQDEFYDAL